MVLKLLDLTVSNFGECSGLERTDFNSFYFENVWQCVKELILTLSTLGKCGGLERTDFNSFYFGKVWQC